MEVKVEVLGWTLSFWLGQTGDLDEDPEGDDDPRGPGAGAADRGLDLSTTIDTGDHDSFDVGGWTPAEREDRRTGFA